MSDEKKNNRLKNLILNAVAIVGGLAATYYFGKKNNQAASIGIGAVTGGHIGSLLCNSLKENDNDKHKNDTSISEQTESSKFRDTIKGREIKGRGELTRY